MARILVVDDDTDVLVLVERVLSSALHDVICAADAMRGMELINATDFDMVISDINMPHFTGHELVSTIKRQKRFQNIAVAMLTGLSAKKHIDQAIATGVDDYIVKPIDPHLLVQKVARMLEKKPPEKHPEFDFMTTQDPPKGEILLEIQVASLTEVGMVLLCPFKLEPGMVFEVKSSIFDEIGIQNSPPCRVIHAEPTTSHPRSTWRIKTTFVNVSEWTLQKIRTWIYTLPKSRHVA